MKKALAFLLAAVLIFSVCASAYAAETLEEQIIDMEDDALLFVFEVSGRELVERGMIPKSLYEKIVSAERKPGTTAGRKPQAAPAPQAQQAPQTISRDISSGTYVIGQDIPAGTYRITCTGTDSDSLGSAYASLGNAFAAIDSSLAGYGDAMGQLGGMFGALYGMTAEIISNYGEVQKSVELKTNETTIMTLSVGTALKISDGKCRIETAQ